MRQKILLILVAFAIADSVRAQTYSNVTIGYLKYDLAADTAIVKGFATFPADSVLNIPETVEYGGSTYRVTTVGQSAFSNSSCFDIKHLSMPGIRRIEDYAFYLGHCRNIVDLTKVEYIGNYAFRGDGELTDIFTVCFRISMDIKHIGIAAFQTDNMAHPPAFCIIVEDADTIYEQGGPDGDLFDSRWGYNYVHKSDYANARTVLVVPMGKGSLFVHKWNLWPSRDTEIYSPVPVNKPTDGYSTMVITEDNPAMSFTFNGVTYENYYAFSGAFAKDELLPTLLNPVSHIGALTGESREFGKYSIFHATDYQNRNDKEGALFLKNLYDEYIYPDGAWDYPHLRHCTADFKAGDGFLLKGPAADTLYLPLIWNDNRKELYDIHEDNWPYLAEYNALDEKRREYEAHITYVWVDKNGNEMPPDFFPSYEEEGNYEIVEKSDPNYPPLTMEERDRWRRLGYEDYSAWMRNYNYFPDRTIIHDVYSGGTNYFKAGTGAVVPRESDGCWNFYFSASKQAFYQCNNTVIPKDRAYLALPKDISGHAKLINIVFDNWENEITGIVDASLNDNGKMTNDNNDTWYTLDGRKLDGKPTTKGIYIHNGRKEVIK